MAQAMLRCRVSSGCSMTIRNGFAIASSELVRLTGDTLGRPHTRSSRNDRYAAPSPSFLRYNMTSQCATVQALTSHYVMEAPSAYIPIDRRQALARGEALPDRVWGAVLFADISGFTPLTEALARTLGSRRGAEELTRQLNAVYDSLIAEVDRYGGRVVGFSGDAITCWFDGDNGQRATACALELHGAMAQFGAVRLPSGGTVTLAMKIAVASGTARRFVVGDPAVQA